MLFTSLDFFLFLPLVLAVFALTPVAQRWAVLLLASYVFYGFAQPFNLVYLGAVTLVVFACGWGIARARQQPLRVAVFVSRACRGARLAHRLQILRFSCR